MANCMQWVSYFNKIKITVILKKKHTFTSGGYDGTAFLSIVEIYDPTLDRWEIGPPMTSGRSGHASAVSYHYCSILSEQWDPNNGSERSPS